MIESLANAGGFLLLLAAFFGYNKRIWEARGK